MKQDPIHQAHEYTGDAPLAGGARPVEAPPRTEVVRNWSHQAEADEDIALGLATFLREYAARAGGTPTRHGIEVALARATWLEDIADHARRYRAAAAQAHEQGEPPSASPQSAPEGFGTWIACADEMPQVGVAVWGGWFRRGSNCQASVVRGRASGLWHDPDDRDNEYCDPTHWMPLPDPPGASRRDGTDQSDGQPRPQGNDA